MKITKEQIEEIKKLLIQRNSYKEIKNILDNLPKDDTKEKVRKLISESGRTNMISIDKLEETIGDF